MPANLVEHSTQGQVLIDICEFLFHSRPRLGRPPSWTKQWSAVRDWSSIRGCWGIRGWSSKRGRLEWGTGLPGEVVREWGAGLPREAVLLFIKLVLAKIWSSGMSEWSFPTLVAEERFHCTYYYILQVDSSPREYKRAKKKRRQSSILAYTEDARFSVFCQKRRKSIINDHPDFDEAQVC